MAKRLMEELDGSKKDAGFWEIRALQAEEKLLNIREIVSTVSNDDTQKVTLANNLMYTANTHHESNSEANYSCSEVSLKSEPYWGISGVISECNQNKKQPTNNETPDNDAELLLCGCNKSENIGRQRRHSAEKIQLCAMYSLEKCFINVIHKHLSYKYPDERHVDVKRLSEVSFVLKHFIFTSEEAFAEYKAHTP